MKHFSILFFSLITSSFLLNSCVEVKENSNELQAEIESETTNNSISWQDIYDKQKKYNFEKPQDILDEFGDLRFNSKYSRYEVGYKLDTMPFRSSSGQILFLEGDDGHMYTYRHDLQYTDKNVSSYTPTEQATEEEMIEGDDALVILFTVAYRESGYETSGSKYDRPEIHFVSMSKNSSNKWDVNKIKTMDIHTSDFSFGSISDLYYLKLSNSTDLTKGQDVLLDQGFNDNWVFSVVSRGGSMGAYWSRTYTYRLNDLNFVLSGGEDNYITWDDYDNIVGDVTVDIFGDTTFLPSLNTSY